MCDFGGSFAVWLNRKMWLQSINRFRDQGVMAPKNTARSAELWPCEAVTTRTVVSGGSAALTSSDGAIPLPPASRSQTPQATELLRLVLPPRTQVNHTFLAIKPILNSIQNLSGELQPFMYAAMPFLDWTLVHAHPREILNRVISPESQCKSELHLSDVNRAESL